MIAAGIPPNYSVTSIRAASITKLVKLGADPTMIDRFTHHSEAVHTITKYYDKNNNQQARAMLADLADDEHQESERE
jgi:hypothetical protein